MLNSSNREFIPIKDSHNVVSIIPCLTLLRETFFREPIEALNGDHTYLLTKPLLVSNMRSEGMDKIFDKPNTSQLAKVNTSCWNPS